MFGLSVMDKPVFSQYKKLFFYCENKQAAWQHQFVSFGEITFHIEKR